MAIYHVTLFNHNHSRVAGRFVDFDNDGDVKAHARRLLKRRDTKRVEVRREGRLIFTRAKGGRPRKRVGRSWPV
jgi:hypothetical protein